MAKRSSLYDQANSFGWVSIALHWSAAIVLTVLWFVGSSISLQTPDGIDARRSLHITLGLIFWLLLAGRVIWRVITPHPHVTGQSLRTHLWARRAHNVMLLLVAMMLISGPLLAWSLSDSMGVKEVLYQVHATAARVLVILVILHVLAALKHLMFHDDETIARIFVPKNNA